jgi:hypothetical protein
MSSKASSIKLESWASCASLWLIDMVKISPLFNTLMTLLSMKAYPIQLFTLKALLNSFAKCSNIMVNYDKSNIYLIEVSNDKMLHLARTFNCQIGSFLFTYLGLPLSLTKPKIVDFCPLIQRVEKRLYTTSMFLSMDGRLELVNSCFSSLPTFYMCSLRLSVVLIMQIDRYWRHCILGLVIWITRCLLATWSLIWSPDQNPWGAGGHRSGTTQLELSHEIHSQVRQHTWPPWVDLIWNNHYH